MSNVNRGFFFNEKNIAEMLLGLLIVLIIRYILKYKNKKLKNLKLKLQFLIINNN